MRNTLNAILARFYAFRFRQGQAIYRQNSARLLHITRSHESGTNQLGIVRPSNNYDPNIYRIFIQSLNLGPNDSYDMSQAQHSFTWTDTFSYSLGKHFLRLGGLYTHTGTARDFPFDFDGLLGFSSLQNFLLGVPYYAFNSSGVYNHRFLLNDSSIYAQDDYKIARDLTLNLGLRWDLISAPEDAEHRIANVVPSLLAQGKDPRDRQ